MAGTFEGRRTEKIERYTETSRGSIEREREREHISRRMQAQTQKRRRRCGRGRIRGRRTKTNRDPHVAQRAPKKGIPA
jgi:hypothetical protein